MAKVKCLRCDEEADGLDDKHCQLHWEEVADEGFWEYVASPEYAELEMIAELEEIERNETA